MGQYQHVFFEPWIGPQYENGGLWNRKVLIVGESHYDEWEDGETPKVIKHDLQRGFTRGCVQEVVNGVRGARYWNRVRNRLGGEEHENQTSAIFWNKVAFYNFIQSPVSGGPGIKPKPSQWAEAVTPFGEVLGRLKPARVVFTGTRLWSYVPRRRGKLPDVEVAGQSLPVEFFEIDNGRHVYVTATPHPRSQYFTRTLTPPLREFVVRDWAQDT